MAGTSSSTDRPFDARGGDRRTLWRDISKGGGGYPSRVVYPSQQAISSLQPIYNIALGLDSSGILLSIVALPPAQGGCDLPLCESLLLPFLHCLCNMFTILYSSTLNRRCSFNNLRPNNSKRRVSKQGSCRLLFRWKNSSWI